MIEYLVLAVAPGVFWLWFFWRKDKYEKEPARYLVVTFLLGVAVVVPAAFLEGMLTLRVWVVDMMMVGIIEEAAKFSAVFLYVYRKSEFNEVMDGIIYSAAAALGFASLENLLYIFQFGPSVMVGRAVISTLGHVLFASFWGYALGLKKITNKNAIPAGLILSMVAHGIYDVIVMSGYWYITLLVIPFMILLYKSMSRKIKQSLVMSPFKVAKNESVKAGFVQCSRCGMQVPRSAKFCPRCGNAMRMAAGMCSKCGAAIPKESKFCPYCGEKV